LRKKFQKQSIYWCKKKRVKTIYAGILIELRPFAYWNSLLLL